MCLQTLLGVDTTLPPVQAWIHISSEKVSFANVSRTKLPTLWYDAMSDQNGPQTLDFSGKRGLAVLEEGYILEEKRLVFSWRALQRLI